MSRLPASRTARNALKDMFACTSVAAKKPCSPDGAAQRGGRLWTADAVEAASALLP
jgi:hypothetical protein